MKYIITILTIILSINLVFALNGTGTINLSESNLSEGGLFIDSNSSLLNLNIIGNLSTTGSLYLGELIKGNFIIKTMTIGTEKVPGIVEDAIQMTSYEGDFYKHPELNVSSEISTASFIASERFLNQSECTRFHLGVRGKVVKIKRRFWFDSERIEFNDLVVSNRFDSCVDHELTRLV